MNNITPMPGVYQKQELLNRFFRDKHNYRMCQSTYRQDSKNMQILQRRLKKLDKSYVFTAKRLAEEIKVLSELQEQSYRVMQIVGLMLHNTVRLIDHYLDLSVHEQAAMLSINHVVLERFKPWRKQGGIRGLALSHAEVLGESSTFIGDTDNRDFPVFNAIVDSQQDLIDRNPELKAKMNELFTKTFGPLTKYRTVKEPDGTLVTRPIPPELTLVQ